MWAIVGMSVLLIALMLWFNPMSKRSPLPDSAGKIIVKHGGSVQHLADMDAEEQVRLRKMLKPAVPSSSDRFDRAVWTQDMKQVIGHWVPNEAEAASVARWVYVYSKRFRISPEVILAVIAVESHFNRFAVSNVGARGLMQVMPFWKSELGSGSDNLLDIETNVRYGCAILRTYLNRYGTLSRALAAYNGSLGGDGAYPARIFAQMKQFKASAQDIQSNG